MSGTVRSCGLQRNPASLTRAATSSGSGDGGDCAAASHASSRAAAFSLAGMVKPCCHTVERCRGAGDGLRASNQRRALVHKRRRHLTLPTLSDGVAWLGSTLQLGCADPDTGTLRVQVSVFSRHGIAGAEISGLAALHGKIYAIHNGLNGGPAHALIMVRPPAKCFGD